MQDTPRQTWRSKARASGVDASTPLYAIGFHPAWRRYVKTFFQDSPVSFVAHGARVPHGHTALIWGKKYPAGLHRSCTLWRLEDGFLRSVGLGIEFARPLSWIVDSRGLYFDATGPSDLEHSLNHQDFSPAQLLRAQNLQAKICRSRISKYNTPGQCWQRPDQPRVLLIAGQVETDASIEYGSTNIRTNRQLVEAVKATNPDAWLVYKPHPDVVAGGRAEGAGERDIARYCNEIVANTSLEDLLQGCDEVHVNTSLTGFEALLRNKPVTCYGLPFYAGWGLTTDTSTCLRRQRKRTLNELIAATLIEYPLYISRKTGEYTTPEHILDELTEWLEQSRHWTQRFQVHCGKATRGLANLLIGRK